MSKATLLQGDCLELMNRIPDSSIDMVLSDLPYGTTRCRWDTPINLQELWEQYRRVVKENGAIALFSAQPFTTELISSNKAMYRYEWIWKKTQPSGFMNAKKMPLRTHENIEIFYRKPPTYNPQMTHGHQRKTATAYGTRESDGSSCYGREERNYTYDSTDRYPVDVLQYSTGSTKEIQSGCCVDLEKGSDDLSVEMLNVKPFDLVRLAYGLVAAVQRLGMRDKLEQYANGVGEGQDNG